MSAAHNGLGSRRAALLTIGLQDGFLSRTFAPLSAQAVLETTCRLARHCRTYGVTVVAARMVSGAPSQAVDRMLPVLREPPAPGWDRIADEIAELSEVSFDYTGWDVTRSPRFCEWIEAMGIRHLLLAGLTTNFAIESTGRSAWEDGISVTFVDDAITSVNADLHRTSLKMILPRIGFVRRSGDLIDELKAEGTTCET